MLSVLIGGCGRYFAPDRNIRDRVDESTVLGTWRLTPRSLKLLERDGFRRDPSHEYRVTFNPDHSCVFASVFDDPGAKEYAAMPCTWSLEHDTTGDSNVPKVNALRLAFKRAGVNESRYLNFAREREGVVLWNDLGDPDSWEFIEYARVKTTASDGPLQPTSGNR